MSSHTEIFDWSKLEDTSRLEHNLSHAGCGAAKISSMLNEDFRSKLLDEIVDEIDTKWIDAGDTYYNNRGVEITQNHDVFALKLSRGDQSQRARLPFMDRLAEATQTLTRSLGELYPALIDWQADEMSYHRYYDAEEGLTFHRDNLRFIGLIAVVSVMGECDFQIVNRDVDETDIDPLTGKVRVVTWDWHSTYTIPTNPGDVVLTRAPGLFVSSQTDDRPEHAIMNVRVLPRISFMLRANNRPDDTGYGFTYQNWP